MTNYDLNAALQKLEQQNIHLSPQRMAVLEYLYSAEGYRGVDDILKSLVPRYRTLNASTVYNHLRVFRRLGMVKEVTIGGSARRYEAAS
ncbi:Fur family transcriptional regulator [Paenibacillus nasutitermitis]|uniref:Transcriptional repressor n=1 Tax=Paenibacillus nasutitermitis TaxID=1652958 RepID=A0A916ZIE8_9BACL|nr:transcriptional repressor [Paenibacillus nasutitermitis]GGD98071.1 hypothetical protein GCM10010911_66100 [Paenibacillus nasutitermitis]